MLLDMALIVLLLIIFSSNAYGNGLVFGTIKYQDGTPAVDVVLNINNTSIVAVSDEQGKYQLENVPLGQARYYCKAFRRKS